MWVGLIFICLAPITKEQCGMDNFYVAMRVQRTFDTQEECIERSEHHLESTTIPGDRNNARIDCEPRGVK
jgi:hypothetical protein